VPAHKETSDTLIGPHKRRPGTHGKWMPTTCWIDKMKLDGVDNLKLQRALEFCGAHVMKIEDTNHQHLRIEIVKRRLPPPLGIKAFICCSTPTRPNLHVGNYDEVLFGKTLKVSWD